MSVGAGFDIKALRSFASATDSIVVANSKAIRSALDVSESYRSLTQPIQELLGAGLYPRYVDEVWKPVHQLMSQNSAIIASVNDVFRTINSDLSNLIRSASSQLFTSLPEVGVIQRVLDDIALTAKSKGRMEDAGYGLVVETFGIDLYRSVGQYSFKTAKATVTKKLARELASREAVADMESLFTGSKALHKRWPIVRDALEAHRQQKYNLSVPVLMAQIEGIVGDLLIVRTKVKSRGRDLLLLDKNGHIEMDRGKPKKIHGLKGLLDRDKFADNDLLEKVSESISDALLTGANRNGALHGRWTSYGKAQWSVKSILILWIAAFCLAELEAGRVPEL